MPVGRKRSVGRTRGGKSRKALARRKRTAEDRQDRQWSRPLASQHGLAPVIACAAPACPSRASNASRRPFPSVAHPERRAVFGPAVRQEVSALLALSITGV